MIDYTSITSSEFPLSLESITGLGVFPGGFNWVFIVRPQLCVCLRNTKTPDPMLSVAGILFAVLREQHCHS